MRQVALRCGVAIPVLGQGTWAMGEDQARRRQEVAALRLGLELGMTLLDTAEMYADGGAEEVVGEAIAGARERAFVVSKVLPQNASRQGTVRAAERSLRRLRTAWIDLYLLHWEGSHPLGETLAAFAELRDAGKIRAFGVSNFDARLLARARALPHGEGIAANQVLYNLTRRGIEHRLLPHCQRAGVVVMAYTPLEQGRLPRGGALARVAARHGCTPAQVALAWTIRSPGVVAIPKAARAAHVHENAAAAELCLTAPDLAELDAELPPPRGEVPLEML